MLDNAKNFAKVTVSTGYDAAATSVVLSGGHGAKLPAAPFNAVWWNSTDYSDPADDPNVEIVRVTAIATDTLTVTRGQEGIAATTKNTASKTYKMIAGLTAKVINTDLVVKVIRQFPDDAARLITDGSGSGTVGAEGYQVTSSATTTRHFRARVRAYQSNTQAYNRSPETGYQIQIVTLPTTGSSFFGIGAVSAAGTGHTYTDDHIGFKILVVAGVATLYATQADGTTETASSALTTVAAGDVIDVFLKVNGSGSVDYYWSKNGGAWSAATNLTANIPTVTTTDNTMMQVSVSNNSTATEFDVYIGAAHYAR